MHHLDANKTAEEKARRQLHKNAASNIEQVLAATPHKALASSNPQWGYIFHFCTNTLGKCMDLLIPLVIW